MPPIPRIGTSGSAWRTCHTHRTAIGRIAGPDKPPVMPANAGRIVSVSITIPSVVLIIDSPSAPAVTQALAMSGNVCHVWRQLREDRGQRTCMATNGVNHRTCGARVTGKDLAAAFDVWTRDVDFDRGYSPPHGATGWRVRQIC